MAVEITIPRLGWSMEEGVFSQWLKNDGETIREGDALFELESDKAVQQVESFDGGILSIPADGPQPGETVKVGQRIGYLCRKGEVAPSGGPSSTEPAAVTSTAATAPTVPPSAPIEPVAEFVPRTAPVISDRPAASPSARRMARKMGVDIQEIQPAGRTALEQVTAANGHDVPQAAASSDRHHRVSPRAARTALRLGVNLLDVVATGSTGRIRECDIIAAANRQPAPPLEHTAAGPPAAESQAAVPPARTGSNGSAAKGFSATSLRRTIANKMLAAAQSTAAVTLHSSAVATELVGLRQQFKNATSPQGEVPSFTELFVKLSARALESHPTLLGQWTNDGILTPHELHIAVAVDTPAGLLTPVLRDVPELSLAQISNKLRDLIGRARDRRLTADELQGGVFTISNLGGYRVDGFTPLLNLPQTAILGIGRIAPQATPLDGQLVIRERVALSLTFDHRVVDGAAAAALLTTICELVESPLPALF